MAQRSCDVKPIVRELLTNWTRKLAESTSEKPEPVVATYEKVDSVLLPTCANGPKKGQGEIKIYFEGFLKDEPRSEIDTQAADIGGDCDFGFASGLYTFTLHAGNGPQLHARYTFIFHRTASGWLIAQHHSSLEPVPRQGAAGCVPH
ncbi:MAG TPA: nuclear transport factor 2 family protein [Xanthobacteraceae bacterium]|nr:nuclear transport factor 2 family protein [Xanthobacteraceae bacterium]